MAAILMIDDERAILELVKNGLQKDGHFVTAYTSAAQVPLDKLNRYDLIILDIMMPDIDGFSYCDTFSSLEIHLQEQMIIHNGDHIPLFDGWKALLEYAPILEMCVIG